ncbi:LD-carboxypeptidase [Bacillus sp. FJAT-49736]|uniref:S66 peptidase family protein n=1 Tax=Bacillus sp. FJAT-49736 TaxID=2833582 RepID=UPI002016718B|nr:LD-carboxypeptidase [Bacillus sp. FJAT-49736]
MKRIKGKKLIKGDTIGITAPAGPSKAERVPLAIEAIKELGFQVKVGKSCYEEYGGYLAGTPQSRAEELNEMFADPEIDAILCLRGGYGSAQLLDLLDYEVVTEHPKLFIGYSDITALHIAFFQKCGLATIHGPMATTELIDCDEFSRSSLLATLTKAEPLGEIKNPDGQGISCLVEGTVEGEMVGGNLSLVTALLCTPYELDTKGKLLFLEDIGEEPYKVDRMLTQLALAGKIEDAAGLIFGTFTESESPNYAHGFDILDVIENIVVPFGKPVIYNLQAGHCKEKITLPFGVKATLDANNKRLIVEESVVQS